MMMQLPDGVTGEMTSGACPTQIEGKVDGKHFYYRARWGTWTFTVGDSLTDAVLCKPFRHGVDDWFGWVPSKEAWGIVLRCIEEWREEAEQSGQDQD